MKEGYAAISVDSEGSPLVDRAPVAAAGEGVSRTKRVVVATLGVLLAVAGAAVAYSTTATGDDAAKIDSMTLPGNQPPPFGKPGSPPGPPPPFGNSTGPPPPPFGNFADGRPPLGNSTFPPWPSGENDPRPPFPNATHPGDTRPPIAFPNFTAPSLPNGTRSGDERPPPPSNGPFPGNEPPRFPNVTFPGGPPLPLGPDEFSKALDSPPIVLRATSSGLCLSAADTGVLSLTKCGPNKSLAFKYNPSTQQLKSVECNSCLTDSGGQSGLHLESCTKASSTSQAFVPRPQQSKSALSLSDSTGKKCLSVDTKSSQATELRMNDCDPTNAAQQFEILPLPGGGPPKI